MPVQNSNSKISAHPDLASNLHQIPKPNIFNSLLCHKRQFTHQLCPKRWFVRKRFGYYPKKSKLKILYRNVYLSKNEVFRKLLVQKTGSPCTYCTFYSYIIQLTSFYFRPHKESGQCQDCSVINMQ